MRAARLGVLALGLCLLASGRPTTPALAQATALVTASTPSAEAFPQIHFFLSVDDAQGVRRGALPPTSFRLFEDDQPIPSFDLRESSVGVRVVYALNSAAPMRRRDALGRTRFQVVQQALLKAWAAETESAAGDDLSLVTSEGSLASHEANPARLAEALAGFSPGFPPASGYGLLIGALDIASSPAPRPGMETHLVFLTPLVDQPIDQDLANAVAAAAELHTVLHTVLIGTPEQALVLEAVRLREAAIATGGTFTVFDPERGFGPLIGYLSSRRTRYDVAYLSQVQATGRHTVKVGLETSDLQGQSEPVSFDVQVQPPQAAFILPPTRIVRKTDNPNVPLTDIPPIQQTLSLLVDFPDGHPRALVQSQLLVDGAAVETLDQPPFDTLTWDLSTILENGRHRVQAAVVDRQGLRATTEAVMVEVQVIPGPQGMAALRPAVLPLAASFVLAFSAIAWINLWVTLGRQPDWIGAWISRPLRRARLSAHPLGLAPEASLIVQREDGTEGTSFPWDGADLMIGSDPSRCGLLFNDPSVSPLHARLVRRASGACLLRDQNSVAGTWVNDERVPEEGRRLEQDDRIYLGRVALRFRWTTPPTRAIVRVDRRPPAPPETSA